MKALLFCLQEGWSSLRRNPAASLAAITALSAVLFVLLLFLLLSRNVLMLAGRLEERKGLTVFLDPDTSPERRAELEAQFRGFPEVKDLRFLSRDQALEDIEGDLETSGIATVLDGNPLPDAFLLYPVPSAGQAASLTRLADEIRAYPGVEDVIYGERWVQALDRGLAAVRRGNLVTGALAMIAIMLVLANTLRLLVLMREDQLSVMQLIGATNAYLRTPFLTAGVLLCLAGALVSQALLYAGFLASRSFLPGLRFLSAEWLIAFLAGVLVVGAIGSFATVEASLRSLERNREEAGA